MVTALLIIHIISYALSGLFLLIMGAFILDEIELRKSRKASKIDLTEDWLNSYQNKVTNLKDRIERYGPGVGIAQELIDLLNPNCPAQYGPRIDAIQIQLLPVMAKILFSMMNDANRSERVLRYAQKDITEQGERVDEMKVILEDFRMILDDLTDC